MGFDVRQIGSLAKLKAAVQSTLSGSMGSSSGAAQRHGLPIGVDFGAGSLKLLQVGEGEPPTLVAAACLETPDELVTNHQKRLEFQIEALPDMIRNGGFRGRRAVCALPSWTTVCKVLQMTRQDGVPISALVEAAIPVQLQCDIGQIVYRFIEVMGTDKPGSKVEVIVIAVARELVARFMRTFTAAKLEPVGMHSEFAATLRAFDYVHRREADASQNTLYVDIGAATSNVMIAHGKDLAFARVIAMGGRSLDEMVAKQRGCDLAEARKIRQELNGPAPAPARAVHVPAVAGKGAGASVATEERRTGDKPAPGFAPELTGQPAAPVAPDRVNYGDLLEGFTDELRLCMRYHAAQFPGRKLDRIVFVGGESRQRGLCQHVAKTLRLPAQMADPLARAARTGKEPALGVDLRQPQPGWAVALGLCLSPTDL